MNADRVELFDWEAEDETLDERAVTWLLARRRRFAAQWLLVRAHIMVRIVDPS